MLYEKGVAFKERLVFIPFGEQHESWYRRVNPNGLVPAMQDGGKMVLESEEIINYVDKARPCGKVFSVRRGYLFLWKMGCVTLM